MIEPTHREILERLIKVEEKVDKIETNTEDMVSAFNAARGAFTVLEWLAKVVKPLLLVGAFLAAVAAAFSSLKIK